MSRKLVLDSLGREVPVPSAGGLIYPAGHPATVLLAVMVPGRMAGWTRPPVIEARSFLADGMGVPRRLPRLGPGADTAAARRCGAELILDVGTAGPAGVAIADDLQSRAGVPVALLDGRLEALPTSLRLLGDLLQDPDRGAALADEARRVLEETARLVRDRAPVRIHYACGPDGLDTPPAGWLALELFRAAGAEPLAVAGGGGLARVEPDQVASWSPDWIVALDPAFAKGIAALPDWRDLGAVQHGRVVLSPQLPWPWLDRPPGINRLLGLTWLASVLHGLDREERNRRLGRTLGVLFPGKAAAAAGLIATLG